jgi:hypothetical protein
MMSFDQQIEQGNTAETGHLREKAANRSAAKCNEGKIDKLFVYLSA